MSKLKTFFVEYRRLIFENLARTLTKDANVEVVAHVEEEKSAIEQLRVIAPFDLLIVDIFLSSGSGFTVLKAAQDAQRKEHLVVLTNGATPELRKRCKYFGAEKVFDKIYEIDDLISYCISLSNSSQSKAD